jgi:transcription initiation factor TFIIIB Brf1 subunit/transcription initiation factor TFIIB
MNCEHAAVSCDDGERVCTDCGTILGSIVDEGAEWRVYANTEDDPSRTGGIINELLPDSSYGSMMMRRRIPGQSEEAKSIARLSAWSFSSHGERSWMGIFDAIQASCSRIGLPKAIIHDACSLFKKVEDARKSRGETRRALMAGAVFTACRQHNATRTHEEVAGLFHVSIRAMCKGLSRFSGEVSSVLNTQLGIAERICADLNISDTDRDAVLLLLNKLPEMEHTPKTIVAGVVSHVLGGRLAEISTVSGVSSVSIRKMTVRLSGTT